MARNKFDVDEKLEGEFNFGHLKRLLKYLKPHVKTVILTLFAILSSSALNLLSPMITSYAIDYKIPQKDLAGIIFLGLGLFLIYLYNAFTVRYRITSMSKMGQSVVERLREDLFVHLQTLPFSYYDSRPHGKILVRVINYVNALSDLLSNGIINLISDIFNVAVIFAFMLYIDLRLTGIVVVGGVIFTIAVFSLKDKQRRAWQLHSAKQSNLNAYIHESITGIKVTQSFTREWENQKIFEKQSQLVKDSFMKGKIIDICIWPLIETVSTLTTAVVFLVGAHWIFTGSITVGKVIAFTGYVSMFWNPIMNISNFYNSINNAMAYLERIYETMDIQPTVRDVEGAVEMPPIKGDVEFSHVYFSYDEGKPVLEDVSFKVKSGETVALVGPTGAGKTTIINIISRFYDIDRGKVLIDGQDIKYVTLNSLRKQMGVMLQDTFIFSGTIMDNIRYGKLDATDEEVIEAAKAVCAHDFIMTLENGYYTQVNERGSRLSAGQRQLISFARALLADPKILILDEATSSIDTQTEIALQKGLNRLLQGRTTFVIAHRLSTIKNADKIMFVDNKNIQEAGNHEELMAKRGHYYKLYTAQYNLSAV